MKDDWMDDALLDTRNNFLKNYKRFLIGRKNNMSTKNKKALERIMIRRRYEMSLYLRVMFNEEYLASVFWTVLEQEMKEMYREYI